MNDTDLAVLTPQPPNTPHSNLATLGTFSVIQSATNRWRNLQLQECFSGCVRICALHRYLIQACTFANLIFFKYHYFSVIAVSEGSQTFSDRPSSQSEESTRKQGVM